MLGTPELFGVDIGQYAIKIARIKSSGKGFTASHLGYEVIPDEVRANRDKSTLAKLVVTAIKKHKMAKGQPVIHVNAGDTILRRVELDPALRGSELEGAVELDLSDSLPFPLDQVYIDYDEKPDVEGKRLAVAGRRDIIDAKTELLAGLGKNYAAVQVDVDAFAFARTLESLGMLGASPVMLVDIGFSRSRFYVFKGTDLIYNREQQVGGNHVNEIIRDVFDIDAAQAETRKLTQSFGEEYHDLVLIPYVNMFAEQMSLALDFYEANNTASLDIQNIYLTGGGAVLKDFLPLLRENIGRPMELLNFSGNIRGKHHDADVSVGTGIHHALAIGLAMEGK
ncbi:MAG: type IV pilus assembly protein PilM [Cardiobacteriaceae bacterium]|nr:type IV pilus assembly protein PilM [Cardiobacteriaceae bacterium]